MQPGPERSAGEGPHFPLPDGPCLEALGELAGLAACACGAPIGLIALRSSNGIVFRSSPGCQQAPPGPDCSFFPATEAHSDLLVVPDARADARFARDLLVAASGISFYAGLALRAEGGDPLGFLSVMDYVARELSDTQKNALRALGRQVTAQLELASLRRSQTNLQAIAEKMAASVFVQRDGRFCWVNHEAEALTGRGREELLALPPAELLHPDSRSLAPQLSLGGLHPEYGRSRYELKILPKSGEERWVELAADIIEFEGRPAAVWTLFDIADRKFDQESLIRQKETLQCILDSIGDGVVVADGQRRLVFVNPAAEQMTGNFVACMPAQPWVERGVYLCDMTAPASPEELPLARAIRGETVKDVELLLKLPDMEQGMWLSVTGAPLRTSDGALQGGVLAFRDITERRAMERMKDEFIAIVSHELRTPLTPVRGTLGLLAGGLLGPLPKEAQELLEIAMVNTERLVRLVNDILDIQNMHSGRSPMIRQTCDLADLMVQAADLVRSQAIKARIELAVTPQSALVWADPRRLAQALAKLLDNAMKFSPPEGTVWFTAERREREVCLRVKDRGRGIPADSLERIFERFHQVEPALRRDREGIGLGLAICRAIVQQHGGRVWAESAPGQGSTFFVTLPLHQIPAV